MNYIKKHSKIIMPVLLFIICFLLYFINMGEYPLLDSVESMNVSISKDMLDANDWANLKLNGKSFFESSPLLFWIMNISFIIFAKISTVAARIPTALICTAGIITLFCVVSKILTKAYALIISLITITSFGFILFGRLATIDMLYTVTTMSAILLSYLLILSNSKEQKKSLWTAIYILIALSILSGGLFGFLPLLMITAMYIFAGKLKEAFIPKNILKGIIFMLVIIIPWFLIMIEQHGYTFFKEFLSVYDISKYFSIKNYIKVILFFIVGFLPWSFSFLWIIGRKSKDIITSFISYFKDNSQAKLKEKWIKLSKVEKFLSLNTIVFFTCLIFAIPYGKQFTCLILFLMFPAACISGFYWYGYMFRKEHQKSIFFSTIIPNLLFIICSLLSLFGYNFINTLTIYGYNYLIVPLVIIFFIIPLIGIFSVILKSRIPAFISNLILMVSLSFVLTPGIFNFITANSGELDLINFARKANTDKVKLSTFMGKEKYSLVYYYDDVVDFHNNKDFDWLKNTLANNKNDYIIIDIKDLSSVEKQDIKYLLVDTGKRYCIIKHLPKTIEKQMESEKEPEINIF